MPDQTSTSERQIESEIVTDFRDKMTYGSYLHLDRLLSAQLPLSTPEHHDELLFIIQHQTTELWLKLVLHELLCGARTCSRADELAPALKCIARVKHIQRTLTEQWSVLATLTPTEYAAVPRLPRQRIGFQSAQYRAVEFLLGNKNAGMLRVFESTPGRARAAREAPGRAEHLRRVPALPRTGPDSTCRPRCSSATSPQAARSARNWCPSSARSTSTPTDHWRAYETCEELVDLEDNFQLWRFRHLKTVQRIIGMKRGTGGSSGVAFLQKALELTFFPELFAVRTEIR